MKRSLNAPITGILPQLRGWSVSRHDTKVLFTPGIKMSFGRSDDKWTTLNTVNGV